MNNQLIEYLSEFITPERRKTFDEVISYRTRYISVLLEDIYQPHNASAVLRTCDCFGIQDVHIVENRNQYRINPDVALGASKWLTLKKYNQKEENTKEALKQLKEQGYRVVATTPHHNDTNLEDFDIEKGKSVLCFGTELNGLSDTLINQADEYLKIPMYGFTESFNISVSAAIILHYLTIKLRASSFLWQLTEQEKEEIMIQWLKNSVKKSDFLIKEFNKKQ